MIYVYLIQDVVAKCVKIGVASNPKSRLASIQTGNPNVVRLIHFKKCHDAIGVEGLLHREFQSQLVRGEWFSLSDADISCAILLINKNAATDAVLSPSVTRPAMPTIGRVYVSTLHEIDALDIQSIFRLIDVSGDGGDVLSHMGWRRESKGKRVCNGVPVNRYCWRIGSGYERRTFTEPIAAG